VSNDKSNAEIWSNPTDGAVAVYGASGHTGRFVVSELQRPGWKVIAAGRDGQKLNALSESWPDLRIQMASIDDPSLLDEALVGAAAVLNGAGPFLDTAAPP
jgi:short subunit dehydrogenase-like uncharacterized protein